MDIELLRREATVDEFIEMRKSVGWGYPDKEAIKVGLENNLFSICIERGNELIGYGRVIGDGGFTLYIQDIIIKPQYQKMGLGSKIMTEIMGYIKENYTSGSMVCLMAAKEKEGFYRKFGFIERPNEVYGAGMIQFIK